MSVRAPGGKRWPLRKQYRLLRHGRAVASVVLLRRYRTAALASAALAPALTASAQPTALATAESTASDDAAATL